MPTEWAKATQSSSWDTRYRHVANVASDYNENASAVDVFYSHRRTSFVKQYRTQIIGYRDRMDQVHDQREAILSCNPLGPRAAFDATVPYYAERRLPLLCAVRLSFMSMVPKELREPFRASTMSFAVLFLNGDSNDTNRECECLTRNMGRGQ